MNASVPELVPARMLNEFVYCPRLAYLEWVQGEFAHNKETLEGADAHRRVDVETGDIDVDLPAFEARSVHMTAPEVGLTARMDLLRGSSLGKVVPIDYKRGKKPESGAWPPERVQVCAQALILRENGYTVDHGELYFVQSKQRERIDLTADLIEQTRQAVADLRSLCSQGQIPTPLADSPKCPRCSLVAICLPDEIEASARRLKRKKVRRLFPVRDDKVPVYVQAHGAYIGKRGDTLTVKQKDGTKETIRLLDLSQLAIMGNVTLSAPAIKELCNRNVPVTHFSYGGWLVGITGGLPGKNIELRQAQFRAADTPERCVRIARRIVATKIHNSKALLARNHADLPNRAVMELKRLKLKAARCKSLPVLLGVEGAAARVYFAHFQGMMKGASVGDFEFRSRNRRPPKDPVNALLSFCYALLTKEATIALASVGLDPHLGFYHQPRYGRPSLALDLMEAFRPLLADSVVITAINNGEVEGRDFIVRAGGTALTGPGRKKLIGVYERRMDTLAKHPVFGYRVSYRQTLTLQARLLGRFLLGELDDYPDYRTR